VVQGLLSGVRFFFGLGIQEFGFGVWGYNYFTEMCSGSEAGSYLRLMDFMYHSTLGLRVIKKKKSLGVTVPPRPSSHMTCSRVLNLRTTTSQKCEAVPRRARM